MVERGIGAANQGTDKLSTKIGEAADATRGLSDQARSTGRDLKEKASEFAGSSTEALKDRASGLVDAAKGVASQAGDKLKETVEGQKVAGADFVSGISEAMRRAAKEFEGPVPIAATYIRLAADQVADVSQSIKTGDINDLVRTAQNFARRQPTAFFGIAALAGFGIIRFLKSSSEGKNASTGSTTANGNRQFARSNVRYRDDFTN